MWRCLSVSVLAGLMQSLAAGCEDVVDLRAFVPAAEGEGEVPEPDVGRSCAPGTTRACTCASQRPGRQLCSPAGSGWSACLCYGIEGEGERPDVGRPRPACVDLDGDGFFVGPDRCRGCPRLAPPCAPDLDLTAPCAADLDDGDPAVSPGACERCDGRDNDGDGLVDEEDPSYVATPCPRQLGACSGSTRPCRGDRGPGPCGPERYGPEYAGRELCGDLVDNDCDGEVGEGCEACVPGPVDRDAPAHEQWVRVCPDAFVMGSPHEEPGRGADETAHRVEITRPFLIRATEVTQGEWEELMGSNPARLSACGTSCPVERVSWYDAVAFCNALSRAESLEQCYGPAPGRVSWPRGLACLGYRLPTEAEWELAARAGTGTALFTGGLEETGCGPSPALDRAGWYCGNSSDTARPVAQKEPNAWGLYDGAGGVFEWTWSRHGPYRGAATDPTGARSGNERVIRGGSWTSAARYCRAAHRLPLLPGYRSPVVGLRPVRSLPR